MYPLALIVPSVHIRLRAFEYNNKSSAKSVMSVSNAWKEIIIWSVAIT